MSTVVDAALILSRIGYKPGYRIYLKRHPGKEGRFYMQVAAEVKDADSGKPMVHTGRKWDISYYMTESEIVMTALKAFLTFEEHEARESFTYLNIAVGGPHLNVVDIVNLVRDGKLRTDVREEK